MVASVERRDGVGAQWRRRMCRGGVAQGARALVRRMLPAVLVLVASNFRRRLRLIKGHATKLEKELANCGGEGSNELDRWRQRQACVARASSLKMAAVSLWRRDDNTDVGKIL
ncbi:hypothetical protein U1Q18_011853 [Sarracenia purpurea var. burkii]